ncbi:MAG TPA: hypothetical protein VLP30_08735, partial [Desulfatirhabdiaceae bacterium]|nr:hypothetical protein [Desulfatirhabdiaceae bacterium]
KLYWDSQNSGFRISVPCSVLTQARKDSKNILSSGGKTHCYIQFQWLKLIQILIFTQPKGGFV